MFRLNTSYLFSIYSVDIYYFVDYAENSRGHHPQILSMSLICAVVVQSLIRRIVLGPIAQSIFSLLHYCVLHFVFILLSHDIIIVYHYMN